MTDLENLATETAGILLNWGKTTAHPDWRAPNEQQIALAMSYMQEAQEQGRIEGLEEATGLCRLVRDGLIATTPDTHEIWVSIRARIKELKGE